MWLVITYLGCHDPNVWIVFGNTSSQLHILSAEKSIAALAGVTKSVSNAHTGDLFPFLDLRFF